MSETEEKIVVTAQNLAKDPFPGKLMFSGPHGHMPGCRAQLLRSEKGLDVALNEWSEKPENQRCVISEIKPIGEMSVLIIYSKHLTREEEDDLDMVSREIHMKIQENREKTARIQEEQEEKKRLLQEENARLAEVGRKYENRVKHIKTAIPVGKEQKAALKELEGGKLEAP